MCPSPHRVKSLKKNQKKLHLIGLSIESYNHIEGFFVRVTFKTTLKSFLCHLPVRKAKKKVSYVQD